MDGLETARRLRERDATRGVPDHAPHRARAPSRPRARPRGRRRRPARQAVLARRPRRARARALRGGPNRELLDEHADGAADRPLGTDRRAGRARDDHALRALGGRHPRRRRRRRLPRALAVVGRRRRGLLGGDLGVLRASESEAATSDGAGLARDAGRASGSRACDGQLRASTSSAGATTTRWRSATPPSCASSASGRGATCARRPPRSRPACARCGVEEGDRVAAYIPNIPEALAALPGLRVARRDLVVVLAGLRRALASSTASRRSSRRSSSPSTATATAGKRLRPLDTVARLQGEIDSPQKTVVLPYLDASPDLGRWSRR